MANCFCFQISGLTLLLNFFSVHQMTPLHLAAERGRSHVVKFLTEKGANVNKINFKGVGFVYYYRYLQARAYPGIVAQVILNHAYSYHGNQT